MGRVLPARPETVWELITDWENQGDWMLEATNFVVLSEEREGTGVIAEATVKIGGISTRDKVYVTIWEPSKRLGIKHDGWVSGEAEMLLTDLGERGTHIFWREELQPPLGFLGAIGLSLFRPLMRWIFNRDLRVLEGLARSASRSI
jgi:carbon monoxide dehydrogenase subunit G